MTIILYFALVLAIFIVGRAFSWWWTEGREKYRPEWLNYKPWSCDTCLSLWLLITLYIIAALIFSSWIILIAGVTLAILNAIAMKINQKEKTISIKDDVE